MSAAPPGPTGKGMSPRITVITLAVADLERSLAFYRDGLGLPTSGITGTKYAIGACVFFQLEGDLKLALWPRTSLRADTGLADSPPGGGQVLIAHNVGSEDEVRQVLAQAVAAGGRLLKPAQPTFWGGYGGYFQDPDGHVWEVVFNPHLQALG
jgi:catechol 2,3-dioxygenase-like lactoylglutathione lyase family enzyme